jgi:hypothetical protein
MDTTEIDTVPGAELLALQQVARIVSREDDAESRIQDILRHLATATGLVRGRVMLADLAAGEIYTRYAHGLTPAELERGRYRIGEGVSGRVFRTGEAVLIANVHDEPGYLARAVALDTLPPNQITFLAVPIVRDHLPVGVLAAHRDRHHDRSAKADLALMEVVATLIAQVLCTEGKAPHWNPPSRPRSRPTPSPAIQPDRSTLAEKIDESRDLTLRMAMQRHREGRLHQAVDLYLKVAGSHQGSEQCLLAKGKLLEIARYYEGRSATRLAADVLVRLQRVLDEADQSKRSGTDSGWSTDPWEDQGFGSSDWDSFGDSSESGGIGIRLR